jgi:hypothetical protein
MFEKAFNREAARDLLEEYKQTASYIGLYEPRNDVDKSHPEEDDGVIPPQVSVGDLIQATVNGEDVFPNGARVLGFSDDGEWVFTDQAKGGLRREEITVLEPAQAKPAQERPTIPPSLLSAAQSQRKEEENPPAGSRRAVFPISEGDVTLIFPNDITADGLRELGMYLNIFLKKEEDAANKH